MTAASTAVTPILVFEKALSRSGGGAEGKKLHKVSRSCTQGERESMVSSWAGLASDAHNEGIVAAKTTLTCWESTRLRAVFVCTIQTADGLCIELLISTVENSTVQLQRYVQFHSQTPGINVFVVEKNKTKMFSATLPVREPN